MAEPTEREHDVSYMERVIEQGEKLSDFGWHNARVSWRRLHRSLIDAEKRIAELEDKLKEAEGYRDIDHYLDAKRIAELDSMLAAAPQPQPALLTNPHTGTPRDYRDVESDPAGVLIQEPGAPLRAAQPRPQAFPAGRGYTVERHGNGWAIYLGRDRQHHGANLGQLTECGPELAAQIQAALNAAPQPQPQAAPVPSELAELLNAATPGPWEIVGSTHSYGIGGDFDAKPGRFELVAGGTAGKDARAIIAAVNYLRALLAAAQAPEVPHG